MFYGRWVASCGAEMKIWLDDLRPAPSEFVWCRSVNEAKKVIEENEKTQPIELIDCDHDLGDFLSTAETESNFWIGCWREIRYIPLRCIR